MSAPYTQTLSADAIASEIQELLEWHSDVLRSSVFTAEAIEKQPPQNLLEWARANSMLDPKALEKLERIHDDLGRAGRSAVSHAIAGEKLTPDLFERLENHLAAYVLEIRRLHQGVADNSVVDSVTGLRSVSTMLQDVKREQDRFDRKGTSYSVASIEIDNLPALGQKYDRRGMDAVYAHVARVLSRSIRSFDDLYFMGKGEYTLVLKHIEFMDACSVMDRLRHEIEGTPMTLSNGEALRMTASLGVAEAMARESGDLVVEHAKAALNEAKNRGGNCVEEYQEVSALLQYARDKNKD